MARVSMLNKVVTIGRYALYMLWSNAVYGLILYFVFVWLARYSPVLAYCWNLVLIIIALVVDEYSLKGLQSPKVLSQLQSLRTDKPKDFEFNYRLIQWLLSSFISFKTVLYLFYAVILIMSPIIDMNPTFLGDEFRSFILANNYSILLLITFDLFTGQFSKDRTRAKQISKNLEDSLMDSHE